MADDAPSRREAYSSNYPRSLELEIINLHQMHLNHGGSLRGAFSQPVVELLRKLSEEEFFQQPNSESPDHSSYNADISTTTGDNTLRSSAATTPENWETTRNLFEFIYTEFMPAPQEERMGKFQRFLDRIWETAHRVRLPDGNNFSPEGNRKLQQCLLAVNTMKEIIGTKFESLKKFMKGSGPAAPPGAGIGSSSGARQTGDASTTNPSGGACQNAPGRNETTLGSLPPRNPEATKVIVENPMHAADGSRLPRPEQHKRPSVVLTNPAHHSSHGASGSVQESRSTLPPPPKRPPLLRQDRVQEDD